MADYPCWRIMTLLGIEGYRHIFIHLAGGNGVMMLRVVQHLFRSICTLRYIQGDYNSLEYLSANRKVPELQKATSGKP